MTSWEREWLESKARRKGLTEAEYRTLFPPKDTGIMSTVPPPDPWQLTLGKYAIQQLPTIITAGALAVGGCYATSQIKQGQAVTHQILEDHTAKIDKAADAASEVKQKLEAKETGK